RENLCVVDSVPGVEAFADDGVVLHNDRAHHRPGARECRPAPCEIDGPSDVFGVSHLRIVFRIREIRLIRVIRGYVFPLKPRTATPRTRPPRTPQGHPSFRPRLQSEWESSALVQSL